VKVLLLLQAKGWLQDEGMNHFAGHPVDSAVCSGCFVASSLLLA
jgi:hypothetical protein